MSEPGFLGLKDDYMQNKKLCYLVIVTKSFNPINLSSGQRLPHTNTFIHAYVGFVIVRNYIAQFLIQI